MAVFRHIRLLQADSLENLNVSRYATEHRCGVVVKGPGLSGNISGTDPLKDNRLLQVAAPLDESEQAKYAAAVVNEVSSEMRRVLSSHPLNSARKIQGRNVANVVLLRGCGIRIEMPTFASKHNLRPCMVAPTKIIAGLGLSLGIDILDAPGATGDYRSQLTSKAAAIARALAAPSQCPPSIFVPGMVALKSGCSEGYEFGFLHIKAVDDAGHDKAIGLKVRGHEAADVMIGQLARLLWEEEKNGRFRYSLAITGDHSTPVEYGDHSFEPVPFSICHLDDFVKARGGDAVVLSASLSPVTLSMVASSALPALAERNARATTTSQNSPIAGDSVVNFSEICAARGCLKRFPGLEMMRIVKKYMHFTR